MSISHHDTENFKKVRDLVKNYMGWSYLGVHKWFHQNHSGIADTPIRMVVTEQSDELMEWVNSVIEEEGEFYYAESVHRPAYSE